MTDRVITLIHDTSAAALFLAVMLLLVSAATCGKLASLARLPKVTGEILGGFLLGPSLFGRFFPDFYERVFFGFEGQGFSLSVIYWLGLVFLMFSSGYDSNFVDAGKDRKIIAWLTAGATILPFALGYIASDLWFADYYIGEAGNRAVFNIIIAIITTVSSLPVISRIFMDLGLINHRFARIVLATGTVQGLILWVILSAATSLASTGQAVLSGIAVNITVTLAMFAFAMLAMPRIRGSKLLDRTPFLPYDSLVLVVCFLFIYIGGLFNVSIMYSAFVAGMVYKNALRKDAVASHTKIKEVSSAFFIPVYFAIVGLRIYVDGGFSVSRFLFFLAIVSALELGGCVLAMKCIKLGWLPSFNLGVAMNARGGPGIVVASIALDLGIINYEFFCVLVFVVLITSAIAGYWIGFINKKGKLLPE